MQKIIDDVIAFETRADWNGALRYLAGLKLSLDQIAEIAFQLYKIRHLFIAGALAESLVSNSFNSWPVHVIRYDTSYYTRRTKDAAQSLEWLDQHIAQSSIEHRRDYIKTLEGLISAPVIQAVNKPDLLYVRHLLGLWKVINPEAAALFALDGAAEPLNFKRLADVAWEGSKLLKLSRRASGQLRPRRKAVVAFRKYYYGSTSRLHDVGPRFVSALANCGWSSELVGMRYIDNVEVEDDYWTIDRLCRSGDVELLVVDHLDGFTEGKAVMKDIIAQLRRDVPNLRIVCLLLDPWKQVWHPAIRKLTELVDFLWTPIVVPKLWEEQVFANKMLLLPFPLGVKCDVPVFEMAPGMSFIGGIHIENWQRGFWIAALDEAHVNLRVDLSSHAAEPDPPLVSYSKYLSRLSNARVNLNFSQRLDGSRTLTDRTFTVPLTGALLVQEVAPDVDHFFVPGEHYLPFSTVADLIAISNFIRDEPEKAEEIRANGYRFAHERYGDDHLIGYLEQALCSASS